MSQIKRLWPVVALFAGCTLVFVVWLHWRINLPYVYSPAHFSQETLVKIQDELRPEWDKYGIVMTSMDKAENRIYIFIKDVQSLDNMKAAIARRIPARSFEVWDAGILHSEKGIGSSWTTSVVAGALYGYEDRFGMALAWGGIGAYGEPKRVYVFMRDMSKVDEVRPEIEKFAPSPWLYFVDGSYIVQQEKRYSWQELNRFAGLPLNALLSHPLKEDYGLKYSWIDMQNTRVQYSITDLTRAHELAEYVSQYIPADSFYFIEASSGRILG